MTKERVLLVLDALYMGGTETHVLGLAKELIKNNTFVAIVAKKVGSLVSTFEELKCPIYSIDFPRTIALQKDHEKNLVKEIEKVIESENISIVHIHQTPSGHLASTAAKNKGIPTVLTIHGTYYPDHEIQGLIKISDAVICVSPPLCNYVKKFGIDNPYLIPNGINLADYPQKPPTEDVRNQLNIPKDCIVLLYASRIAWAKANVCSIFLRACKDLKLNTVPNLHVIVVGDGDKLEDIRFLSQTIEKQLSEKFIHIVGEQKNMHAYYSAADCVVGTGRVALEAMASERQIIAVGNHGYFGAVNNGNFEEAWGHYFGDHGSKTSCSRHLLRNDLIKLLREKEQTPYNGKDFREIIENRFNIEKITKELLNVYAETEKGGNKK